MATKPTGRTRTGRPTRAQAAELDDQLRKTALDIFLERGFDGTTMEAVAQASGISKRTLYGRYPDKRALFLKVVLWAMAHQQQQEPTVDFTPDDLSDALLAIARAALARAVDPDLVRLSRIAMTESVRFPEFAQSAQSLTWSPRIRAVMDVLEHHADQGNIAVEDIEIAAEQFLAMVAATPARLASFGVTRSPKAEERRLRHAVKLFVTGITASDDI